MIHRIQQPCSAAEAGIQKEQFDSKREALSTSTLAVQEPANFKEVPMVQQVAAPLIFAFKAANGTTPVV